MKGSYHFSSTSYIYITQNDPKPPPHSTKSISIPISSPPNSNTAAAKIQAAFRAHRIRVLVRLIRTVDADASILERQIQRQDTVDAVRRDERERWRVNEGLMALLLRLDAVPGIDPAVRELRRRVSRRIVGMQEVLDAVVEAPEIDVVEWFGGEMGGAPAEEAETVPEFGWWESFLVGV